MEKFRRRGIGIESWLKVEAVRALEKGGIGVEDIRSRGPGLKLENGPSVELKASIDFNPNYILNGLDNCETCMFLGFAPKSEKEDVVNSLKHVANNKDFEVNVLHLGRGWFLGVIES